MASKIFHATKKQTSLEEILSFATSLPKLAFSKEAAPSLASTLLSWIDDLFEKQTSSATPFKEIDEQGTQIWNFSLRLRKENAANIELVCLVRIFACLLLDCAHRSTVKSVQNFSRVFKSWLSTTKLCLNHDYIVLAERAAEKCAYYEQNYRGQNTRNPEKDVDLRNELRAEYLLLRVSLAWRQNRLDLAQNWLDKLCNGSYHLSPLLVEKLADLLFEVGKDQLMKRDFAESAQWLDRAREFLRMHDQVKLSNDSKELLNAIEHLLVRALMKVSGDESKQKAKNILAELDSSHGGGLATLMLKLELCQTDHDVPCEEIYSVLLRVVHTVHMTESTFKTIIHHVHSLRSRNSKLAHAVLKDFILSRLLGNENLEYMEKALVTMVWNLTTSVDFAEHDHTMLHFLNDLEGNMATSIGAPATHAAQMVRGLFWVHLLWKCIESAYQHKQYEVAESWCRLALHSTFGNSGEINTSKLQRKFILCLLATSDYTGARDVYSAMSEACRGSLETQYIMYKVGLRCSDDNLASECLDNIYKDSSKDATILYACALEAQKTGQKGQVLSAMQRVLDRYNFESPPDVYLPALLRCAARLLLNELEDIESPSKSNADAICKVFEGAAAQAKGSKRHHITEPFSLVELDWFSRNSYNTALKSVTDWDPAHTLRLAEACLQLIDQYPTTIDASVSSDLSLRRVFCHFLSGSLLISLARVEHRVEAELQHYLHARNHAKGFRMYLGDQLSRLTGGAKDDLLGKAATFLAFDFEAAVRLKSWDDTLRLLEETQVPFEAKLYGTLADIVLSSEAPLDYVIASLQQIVNVSWQSEGNDILKLSRWIRCLFQLALNSRPQIAENLLVRVLGFARDQSMIPAYPSEELEWLATTAFNRAVDFYSSSQDADCKRWAEIAIGIANFVGDEGALRELFQTKYMGLRWEQ